MATFIAIYAVRKKTVSLIGGIRYNQSLCDRVSIKERPDVANQRKRYGDWEVDTVIGRQGGKVLVTLVERKSKLSLVGLADNKTAQVVKEMLLKLLGSISTYVHTLTYDNGLEFAKSLIRYWVVIVILQYLTAQGIGA